MQIVDAHAHFDHLASHDKFLHHIAQSGATQFNLLAFERSTNQPDVFQLPHSLWLKWKYPDRCFLFGGVDLAGIFDHHRADADTPLLQQTRELIDLGCDGIKFELGKPTIRKALGFPLDGPILEPMLALLEQTAFPVLWHVGDPPEFWSEHTVPPWARANRWWYDESTPSYDQINREICSVFDRHPRLNLILPHFFFLSNKLDQAARLLDADPSYHLDLAPGIEMLHNFTQNHAEARQFFLRYASQIVFGSDIGMVHCTTGIGRGPMIRRFLETDDHFPVPEDPFMGPDDRFPDLHGLKLPPEALQKIFAENFYRIVGRRQPRPLNLPKTQTLLTRLAQEARLRGEPHPTAQRVLDEMNP